MKRIIPIVLILLLILSLCMNGCDAEHSDKGTESVSKESLQGSETIEKETEESIFVDEESKEEEKEQEQDECK